ncbi:MAG: DUF4340 domain-containing protein [Verrucomicrobiota bacterium]
MRSPNKEIAAESGGLSNFGLDPAAATIKIQAGTNLVQFSVGGKTLLGDRVYVQPAGSSSVFTTGTNLLEDLPVSPTAWRSPMLIQQRSLVFDRIQIMSGSRRLTLERDSPNQQWRFVEPMSIRADRGRVEHLVQQLRTARVTKFVSDDPKQDLEPFGLLPPEAHLTLALGTNVVFQMQLGKSPEDEPTQVYARCMAHTNIVLVPRELADLIQKPHQEFRDRALLSFRPTQVDRIEAKADENFTIQKQANGEWQILEPFRARADRQLMQLFLEDLSKLEIVRFEKDVVTDFAPYGLLQPSRQYVLKTSVTNAVGVTNQTLVQLDFGQPPTNAMDTIFCRRSDESSVYVVPFADMFRLERAAYALRDRQIWNFASSNVARVTISQNGHQREIVRDSVTRRWSRDDLIVDAAIEETVHRLGRLQAEAWVARGARQAQRFGTAAGKYQLTLYLTGPEARPLILDFGNLAPSGQPYATVVLEQGEPVVFKFPAQLYALVAEYLNVPSVNREP